RRLRGRLRGLLRACERAQRHGHLDPPTVAPDGQRHAVLGLTAGEVGREVRRVLDLCAFDGEDHVADADARTLRGRVLLHARDLRTPDLRKTVDLGVDGGDVPDEHTQLRAADVAVLEQV